MTKWISVKERLPGPGVDILAFSNGVIMPLYYNPGIKTWLGDDGIEDYDGEFDIDKFTYWQPLPEPPIEEPEVKVGM